MIERAYAQHWVAWVFGAVVACSIVLLSDAVTHAWYESYPDDAWMKISKVAVPDHAVGSDPLVTYDRFVTSATVFSADWVVEAKRAENNRQVGGCYGSGTSTYEPEEAAVSDWRLSEYVGNPCALSVGCYHLLTKWYPRFGNWRRKRPISNLSEQFCVTAPRAED